MNFPIYFDGSIPLQEIADALMSRGIHLTSDAAGRTVAKQVPKFLQKDDPKVVSLKQRRKA